MKNVFLLMKCYLDPNEKVPFPKFEYQIRALESMGFNVYYLGIKQECIYLCNKDRKELIYKIRTQKFLRIPTLLIYDALYKATVRVFNVKNRFDLAYIRAMPCTHSYSIALKSIKESICKIVTEIPTYPIEKEIGTEKRLLRKLYFKISNHYLIKMGKFIDLFALIGEPSTEFAGRPAINIENGIYLHNIPMRTPKFDKNEIHLLGLANIARWHGYDRAIEGIKQYIENDGNKKVVLHLVGPDSDGSLEELRRLTKFYKLEDNVIFEGPKFNNELDCFFDNCQLAIGSIGLHRIGYKTASTLKVREYMARGIPFVISASDHAIELGKEFYLTIPADDSPVNIESIFEYVESISAWEELSKSMRKYASDNMTWENQFSKILREIGGDSSEDSNDSFK